MIFDLERQFAGRVMALDRSALPGLSAHAAMRAGTLAPGKLVAARGDSAGGSVTVRRVGPVAIVPLFGLITSDPFLAWLTGGTSPDALLAALREAVADPETTSVILVVNSPGGEVSLMQESAATIRQLRAVKPIVSIARTCMASGAYWLAAQATTVIATPSAEVGSVGVFTVHCDASGLNERLGVVPEYIASDPRKVERNEDSPLSDDARAFLQGRVDQMYAAFVADLALGRGISESRVRSTFGGGRCYGAEQARKLGMVNGIGTFESLIAGAIGKTRGPMAIGRPTLSANAADEKTRLIAALAAGEEMSLEDEHIAIALMLGGETVRAV